MEVNKILKLLENAKYGGKYASAIQPAKTAYDQLPENERRDYLKMIAVTPELSMPLMLPISGPAAAATAIGYGLPIAATYATKKETDKKKNKSTDKVVKDQEPAGPLTATSKLGTKYTQVNDSTYNWQNDMPGRVGYGVIHTNPVTGAYGTYTVSGGSTVIPEEKRLSEDALSDHMWNINNLEFKEEKPRTFKEFLSDFKSNAKDWARERGFIKAGGGKVQKGEDGMIAGEFPPDWNQGEIRQGFQKARPKWLQTVQDAAEDLNNNPQKYGPLSWLFGSTAKYLTGQGGYEDMAAILPVAGKAGNAIDKGAAILDKEIENAFKAKGLREQMAKWDQELITNADRNVINKTTPNWLDELTKYNDDYIKEIDLSNLIKKENPAKDWGIGLAGLSAVGIPGTYFIIRDSAKKKKVKSDVKEKIETREKPEKKADGGKISDLLNDQEFLVNLEKCGGKMKKKACGGKMKKKK